MLLDDEALRRSSVVANCHMNRERTLTGSNGYAKELGFHPLTVLRKTEAGVGPLRWLDMCCGTGNALAEAAHLAQNDRPSGIEIVGVDLVIQPAEHHLNGARLRLVPSTLSTWEPGE